MYGSVYDCGVLGMFWWGLVYLVGIEFERWDLCVCNGYIVWWYIEIEVVDDVDGVMVMLLFDGLYVYIVMVNIDVFIVDGEIFY